MLSKLFNVSMQKKKSVGSFPIIVKLLVLLFFSVFHTHSEYLMES